MKSAIEGLQKEIRQNRDEFKRRIERLEDRLTYNNKDVTSGGTEPEKILAAVNKESEDISGMMEKQVENLQSAMETRKEEPARIAKIAEPRPEADESRTVQAEKMRINRLLVQCEREIIEIDKHLRHNWIRARVFGSRTMKETGSHIVCVYCKKHGDHYADVCPKLKTVANAYSFWRMKDDAGFA
ncbi:hypothetical protein GCK32_000118 [Trichostrongylus colubriformis]|uniref:Uncharacterized protein n=1 Tax=Trichostrongylus colubriformis TaxID=6319 RepID=A0AAN8FJN5_TRICO